MILCISFDEDYFEVFASPQLCKLYMMVSFSSYRITCTKFSYVMDVVILLDNAIDQKTLLFLRRN